MRRLKDMSRLPARELSKGTLTDMPVWYDHDDIGENGQYEVIQPEGIEDDEMMWPSSSVLYPVFPGAPIRDETPERWALRILPSPVVLLQQNGEGYALSLDAGGQDLSWEIALAFLRLASLPPLWLARSLPAPKYARIPEPDKVRVRRAALYAMRWERQQLRWQIARLRTTD